MASLVLDQYLRCAVCMDFFQDPHRLPCGHSFCRRCIEGVRQHCLTFQCPECRQTVYLDGKGVDGLEKERRLGAMVSEFANQHEKSRVCKEHHRTVEGYCETCRQLLCGKCFFSQLHQGHIMGDIEDVSARKKEELVELMKTEKRRLEEKARQEERFKEILAKTHNEITAQFKTMYEKLKAKEAKLHTELSEATCYHDSGLDVRDSTEPGCSTELPEDPVSLIQVPEVPELLDTHLDLVCSISPTSAIHAGTYIPSGKLVLLGLTSVLQLFDEEGRMMHQLALNDKAYDVTSLGESTLAVTTGSLRRLLLICVSDEKFEISKTIDLDTECFHVSSVADSMYVTANGSLVSFFDTDGKRHKTIIMSGMIQYLTISKTHKKIFLNIRSEYVMRTDLKGTTEFKYKNKDLQGVTGLTVDGKCHAYACGSKSNNVHHIDDTGTLIRLILSVQENISCPMLIGINNRMSKLYIVQRSNTFSDECVKLYSVKSNDIEDDVDP
ncbi:hypothetical protein FSP39_016064 [Pinctada imbricata]|uniref:Uncharacterized protein n=1 Tax=Pinctada imbricata TaxID=66713 RepID=A0AA88XZ88_PINIB|nr:hypothetical protein FSP39_016064 [Pinctada imbricata]